MRDKPANAFEKAAAEHAGGSLLGDFWYFLRDNRKWWLLPLLILLLCMGVLIWLSGTVAGPFIYPLF